MTTKIKVLGQNLVLWEGHFDHFQGKKTHFLDFLKVVLEMFRSYLGIILGFKSLTFRCIFSSKGQYMTSNLKIFGQKLALWEGHFDHFGGQKSSFLTFWKLFWRCLGHLGTILNFKLPTYKWVFYSIGGQKSSEI